MASEQPWGVAPFWKLVMALTQPLKWHGGKAYLADWIIGQMPPRVKNPNAPAPDDPGWLHYVEPFAGGLAVLLAQDPEGISEVVNDQNFELINFWRTLQSTDRFAEFQRQLSCVPFSQSEYRGAVPMDLDDVLGSPVECAVNFFIRCRQSMSGRMDSFTPLTRNRTRRGMNEQASAWLTAVEGLPAVHERLRRVVVLNDDALAVIKQQDGPRTLFYCDPPYLDSTRTSPLVYEHEMTFEQHMNLLRCLSEIKGRFILSGYRSVLYDGVAEQFVWRREEREIDNKSGKGASKQKRTECLWFNY